MFDGQLGYLDYALAGTALDERVTGAAAWHINSDEPSLIDYDMGFKQPAQDALWAPDEWRSSDHDPVIVGLDLDVIAPELSVTASPETIFPPNAQWRTVEIDIDATDNIDTDVTVELVTPRPRATRPRSDVISDTEVRGARPSGRGVHAHVHRHRRQRQLDDRVGDDPGRAVTASAIPVRQALTGR